MGGEERLQAQYKKKGYDDDFPYRMAIKLEDEEKER